MTSVNFSVKIRVRPAKISTLVVWGRAANDLQIWSTPVAFATLLGNLPDQL